MGGPAENFVWFSIFKDRDGPAQNLLFFQLFETGPDLYKIIYIFFYFLRQGQAFKNLGFS